MKECRKNSGSKRLGFTLLELIIALSLLAILASVAVSRFVDMSKKTIEIQEKATVSSLRTAVLLFKANNGYWPGDIGFDANEWFRDIFLLLENSPPYNFFGIPPGDGKTWGLTRCNKQPENFVGYCVTCPHRLDPSCTSPGQVWFYYPVTGSVMLICSGLH